MSEAFVGEIRIFSGNFAPEYWAICDGRLLSVNANEVLFSLIGTSYGGDGVTTFALPDFRSRLPVGQGSGPGLSSRTLGQQFGTEVVALHTGHLPEHTHPLVATAAAATTEDPSNHLFANPGNDKLYGPSKPDPQLKTMDRETLAIAGGRQPHNNIMNSIAVNYIICLYGMYPTRN